MAVQVQLNFTNVHNYHLQLQLQVSSNTCINKDAWSAIYHENLDLLLAWTFCNSRSLPNIDSKLENMTEELVIISQGLHLAPCRWLKLKKTEAKPAGFTELYRTRVSKISRRHKNHRSSECNTILHRNTESEHYHAAHQTWTVQRESTGVILILITCLSHVFSLSRAIWLQCMPWAYGRWCT